MMTVNPTESYGRDVACISDADELWSEVTGVDLIVQDMIHVLTCDDFLGPKGNKRGFDVRKLIGMRQSELEKYGPTLSSVIAQDDRIQTVDVFLTEVQNDSGLLDVELDITLTTALGPFRLVKRASELTAADLEGLN